MRKVSICRRLEAASADDIQALLPHRHQIS